MKFEYYTGNSEVFATNLHQDKNSKKLIWDNKNGIDALIVQTSYGEKVPVEELCQALEKDIAKIEIMQDKYVRILPEIWCRYVPSIEKAKNNGCPIHGEPATYTVFACIIDEDADTGKIYLSKSDGMIKPFCDIQIQFHIDVVKEMEVKGILKKRNVDTGFYSLNFKDAFCEGYMDGDVVCRIAEFEVPVTKEMFVQGKVYVKTDEKPEMKSKNKGLCLL